MNARTYTNEEKALGVYRCFWWFVGLLVLHISTFWVPFVRTFMARNVNDDLMSWIMLPGMAVSFVLSIIFIYKFARLIGAKYVWIFRILAANFPMSAPIAWILLCHRAFKELSRLSSRMTMTLSRLGAGFSSGVFLLVGCAIIFLQVQDILNHEKLKKSGQQIIGSLQMVTKNYHDFVFTGFSFTVNYAGRVGIFPAEGKVFRDNALPDGRFTEHPIALIYLPDEPEVAELMGETPSSHWAGILVGGVMALFASFGLYAAIRNILAASPRTERQSAAGEYKSTSKTFVVDKSGQTRVG